MEGHAYPPEFSQQYHFTVSNPFHQLVTPEQYTHLISTISQYQLIPGFMSDRIEDPWEVVLKLLPYSKNTIIDVTLPFIINEGSDRKTQVKFLARYIIFKEQVIGIKTRTCTKSKKYEISTLEQRFKCIQIEVPQKVLSYYRQRNILNFNSKIQVGDFYLITNKFKIALFFQSELTDENIILPYIAVGCQMISVVNDQQFNYDSFVLTFQDPLCREYMLKGTLPEVIKIRRICWKYNIMLLYSGCVVSPSLDKVYFSIAFIEDDRELIEKDKYDFKSYQNAEFKPVLDLSRGKDFINKPQLNPNRVNIQHWFQLQSNKINRQEMITSDEALQGELSSIQMHMQLIQPLFMDKPQFQVCPLSLSNSLRDQLILQQEQFFVNSQRERFFNCVQLSGQSMIKCMYVFNMINSFILSKEKDKQYPFTIGVPFTHKTKNIFDAIIYIFDQLKNFQASLPALNLQFNLQNILQLYRYKDQRRNTQNQHNFKVEEEIIRKITGLETYTIPTLMELINNNNKNKKRIINLCTNDAHEKKKFITACKLQDIKVNFISQFLAQQFHQSMEIKYDQLQIQNTTQTHRNILEDFQLKLRQVSCQDQKILFRQQQKQKRRKKILLSSEFVELQRKLQKKQFESIQEALKFILLQNKHLFGQFKNKLFIQLIVKNLIKKYKRYTEPLSQINNFFLTFSEAETIKMAISISHRIMSQSQKQQSASKIQIQALSSGEEQERNKMQQEKMTLMMEQEKKALSISQIYQEQQLKQKQQRFCKQISQNFKKTIEKCHKCRIQISRQQFQVCNNCHQTFCLQIIEQINGLAGVKGAKQLDEFCQVCSNQCKCDKCKRKNSEMVQTPKFTAIERNISQELKDTLMEDQNVQNVQNIKQTLSIEFPSVVVNQVLQSVAEDNQIIGSSTTDYQIVGSLTEDNETLPSLTVDNQILSSLTADDHKLPYFGGDNQILPSFCVDRHMLYSFGADKQMSQSPPTDKQILELFSKEIVEHKVEIEYCQRCQLLDMGNSRRSIQVQCKQCGVQECYFCIQRKYKQVNYKKFNLKRFMNNWKCYSCDKQWKRYLMNKKEQEDRLEGQRLQKLQRLRQQRQQNNNQGEVKESNNNFNNLPDSKLSNPHHSPHNLTYSFNLFSYNIKSSPYPNSNTPVPTYTGLTQAYFGQNLKNISTTQPNMGPTQQNIPITQQNIATTQKINDPTSSMNLPSQNIDSKTHQYGPPVYSGSTYQFVAPLAHLNPKFSTPIPNLNVNYPVISPPINPNIKNLIFPPPPGSPPINKIPPKSPKSISQNIIPALSPPQKPFISVAFKQALNQPQKQEKKEIKSKKPRKSSSVDSDEKSQKKDPQSPRIKIKQRQKKGKSHKKTRQNLWKIKQEKSRSRSDSIDSRWSKSESSSQKDRKNKKRQEERKLKKKKNRSSSSQKRKTKNKKQQIVPSMRITYPKDDKVKRRSPSKTSSESSSSSSSSFKKSQISSSPSRRQSSSSRSSQRGGKRHKKDDKRRSGSKAKIHIEVRKENQKKRSRSVRSRSRDDRKDKDRKDQKDKRNQKKRSRSDSSSSDSDDKNRKKHQKKQKQRKQDKKRQSTPRREQNKQGKPQLKEKRQIKEAKQIKETKQFPTQRNDSQQMIKWWQLKQKKDSINQMQPQIPNNQQSKVSNKLEDKKINPTSNPKSTEKITIPSDKPAYIKEPQYIRNPSYNIETKTYQSGYISSLNLNHNPGIRSLLPDRNNNNSFYTNYNKNISIPTQKVNNISKKEQDKKGGQLYVTRDKKNDNTEDFDY